MVEYNPRNWFTLIFHLHRSQLMRWVMPNVIGIGLLSGLMVYVFTQHYELHIPAGINIHAFVGLVLGLVLVFRTNTAYDRWWEGRKLFGALVNHSRNMALKLNAMLPAEAEEEREFLTTTISNFFFALKEHLREGIDPDDLDLHDMPYEEQAREVQHIPNLLVGSLQQRFNQYLKEGRIDGDQFRVINREAEGMIDVLGGCERIRKTPIPFSYSVYVKKVIFIYLLTMPLSLINSLGYWTVPMVMFTTYVLAGLELMGEEIEDPFGLDANDLDTDIMAKNIRKNVREILLSKAAKG